MGEDPERKGESDPEPPPLDEDLVEEVVLAREVGGRGARVGVGVFVEGRGAGLGRDEGEEGAE